MATATTPTPTPTPTPATAPPPAPPAAAAPAAVKRPVRQIMGDIANAHTKHKAMWRVCERERAALQAAQKEYDLMVGEETTALNLGQALLARFARSKRPAKRPEYTSAELARCDMFHSIHGLIAKLEKELAEYNAI